MKCNTYITRALLFVFACMAATGQIEAKEAKEVREVKEVKAVKPARTKKVVDAKKSQQHHHHHKSETHKKKHSSKSSSSSSSSSYYSDTKTLHANNLKVKDEAFLKKARIGSLKVDKLENKECIPITQKDLPLCIHKSGTYCFCEDLEWDCQGPAIHVKTSDVCILGNKHVLKLKDPDADGIKVCDSCNFDLDGVTVLFKACEGFSDGSALILDSVHRASVTDLYVRDMKYGIELIDAHHVKIKGLDYSSFVPFPELKDSFSYVGLFFNKKASSDIFLECSHVFDSPGAVSVDAHNFCGTNEGLTIRDCVFEDLTWQGIRLEHFNGVCIQKNYLSSRFHIGEEIATGLIRLGLLSDCNGVVIDKCTAIGKNAPCDVGIPLFVASGNVSNLTISRSSFITPDVPGIFASLKPSNTVENAVIDSNMSTDTVVFTMIAQDLAQDPITGVVIRNNNLVGENSAFGILLINLDGALVENNHLTTDCESCLFNENNFIFGSNAAITLLSTNRSIVRNNAISPWLRGPGIFLGTGVSGPNSNENLVKNNCLNVTARIVDQGLDNEVIGNTVVNSFNLENPMMEEKVDTDTVVKNYLAHPTT